LSDEPLLGYRSNQPAASGEDLAVGQAPGLEGVGTFHHVEQPVVVHLEFPVKPHGMIQAGGLDGGLPEAVAVGIKGGGDQPEVRGVGQHVLVHGQVGGHFTDGLEPNVAKRITLVRGKRALGVDRPEFNGFFT